MALTLFVGCQPKEKQAESEEVEQPETVAEEKFQEEHRPQYHFSPPAHWMNDPNGMVYYDGEYHLFYQHYPDSTVWGPMHWGHAVSPDMVHWEHLPIALYPDSLGYIFSGSAVVDWKNTTGFGSEDNPPLVAMFTYHDMDGERSGKIKYQTQGIAYSTDKGRSWTKYKGNPVLENPGIKDFRDPKVRWQEDLNAWILTLAVKDHIAFYSSPDLKEWTHLSDFGMDKGGHGGVWECPDLFPLPTPDGNGDKWVLFVSINPGAPQGGSGTQYFIGEWDGKTFTEDKGSYGWIDYGPDNYAGVTWADVPQEDGRTLFLGWMSNWLYAQTVPTENWRSAMTVPRKMELFKNGDTYLLAFKPVKELDELRNDCITEATLMVDTSAVLDDQVKGSTTFEAKLTLSEIPEEGFELVLYNDVDQHVTFGYDAAKGEYYLDRSESGKNDFYDEFSRKYTTKRIVDTESIDLRIYVDVASIEIFADEGKTVMTGIFFPDKPMDHMKVEANGQMKVSELEVCSLKSIWK